MIEITIHFSSPMIAFELPEILKNNTDWIIINEIEERSGRPSAKGFSKKLKKAFKSQYAPAIIALVILLLDKGAEFVIIGQNPPIEIKRETTITNIIIINGVPIDSTNKAAMSKKFEEIK